MTRKTSTTPKTEVAKKRATSSRTKPAPADQKPAQQTKLALLIDALSRPRGATIEELMRVTGWRQAHSVRGALAGSLKKKGFAVSSEKKDGEARRYRITGGGAS